MVTLLITFVLGVVFAGLGAFGALVALKEGLRKRVLSRLRKHEANIALLGDEEMRQGFGEGMLLAVALLLILIFLPIGLLMLASAIAQAARLAGG